MRIPGKDVFTNVERRFESYLFRQNNERLARRNCADAFVKSSDNGS